jgi:meso-butanediol dehydrogenase/(S,S)-butanediol dehydrogenase/diacetyl reductase
VKGVLYMCRAAIPHLAKTSCIVILPAFPGIGDDWTADLQPSEGAVQQLLQALALRLVAVRAFA